MMKYALIILREVFRALESKDTAAEERLRRASEDLVARRIEDEAAKKIMRGK